MARDGVEWRDAVQVSRRCLRYPTRHIIVRTPGDGLRDDVVSGNMTVLAYWPSDSY